MGGFYFLLIWEGTKRVGSYLVMIAVDLWNTYDYYNPFREKLLKKCFLRRNWQLNF